MFRFYSKINYYNTISLSSLINKRKIMVVPFFFTVILIIMNIYAMRTMGFISPGLSMTCNMVSCLFLFYNTVENVTKLGTCNQPVSGYIKGRVGSVVKPRQTLRSPLITGVYQLLCFWINWRRWWGQRLLSGGKLGRRPGIQRLVRGRALGMHWETRPAWWTCKYWWIVIRTTI